MQTYLAPSMVAAAVLLATIGCGELSIDAADAPQHVGSEQLSGTAFVTVMVGGLDLLQSATELTLDGGKIFAKSLNGKVLALGDGKIFEAAAGVAPMPAKADLRRQSDGSAWLISANSVDYFGSGFYEHKQWQEASGASFAGLEPGLRFFSTAPDFALGVMTGSLLLTSVRDSVPKSQKILFDAVVFGVPLTGFRGADGIYVLTTSHVLRVDTVQGMVANLPHNWGGLLTRAHLVGVSGENFAGDLSTLGLAVVDEVGLQVSQFLVAGLGAESAEVKSLDAIEEIGAKETVSALKVLADQPRLPKVVGSLAKALDEVVDDEGLLDLVGNLTLTDIGRPKTPGTTSKRGKDAMTLSASGIDVFGAADQFSFLYKALSGDGAVSVRVSSMTNTNNWAKAGIMFRTSLAPNAAHAALAALPTPATAFQVRSEDGANLSRPNSYRPGGTSQWLKIVRERGDFSAFLSSDGVTWLQQGETETIAGAPDTMLVGFFAVSHAENLVINVEFDHAAISN